MNDYLRRLERTEDRVSALEGDGRVNKMRFQTMHDSIGRMDKSLGHIQKTLTWMMRGVYGLMLTIIAGLMMIVLGGHFSLT